MRYRWICWAVTAWAALGVAVGADEVRPSGRVTIAYINDVHAQLLPHPELFWSAKGEEFVANVGGLARVAGAVEALRRERPDEVVFIDGGDTIQGSGPAAWSEGKVVVEPMNALGLDLAVPGNWAVTYGAEILKQRSREFNYPLLASNVFQDGSEDLVFAPSLVKNVKGVRIGFVGFTDPDVPKRQPPFMSEGLRFRGTEVLQPTIDALRSQEKVDVVILVTHIGLNKAVALAETLEGVDVVLSADTHERTYSPIRRGDTWVVEAGAFASFLGVLEIEVEKGQVVDKSWKLLELRPDLFPEDPRVRAVVERSLAPHRERASRLLGTTERWLARYDVLNSGIDTVIADAVRETAKTDFALVNGYRFAPPVAPGPITEGDLWNWLPMELPVKVGEVLGAELEGYWEREIENVFSSDSSKQFGGWLPRPSNMNLSFEPLKPAGQRLVSLQIGGRPVDESRVYTLSSGSYRGAPVDQVHRVAQCRHTRLLEVDVHHAVREYLGRQVLSVSPKEPAIRSLGGPAVLRSQSIRY